jgi:hypothetical protein
MTWGSPFKETVDRALLVSGWTTILITGSGMSTMFHHLASSVVFFALSVGCQQDDAVYRGCTQERNEVIKDYFHSCVKAIVLFNL